MPEAQLSNPRKRRNPEQLTPQHNKTSHILTNETPDKDDIDENFILEIILTIAGPVVVLRVTFSM
jgi:hypothetical protein